MTLHYLGAMRPTATGAIFALLATARAIRLGGVSPVEPPSSGTASTAYLSEVGVESESIWEEQEDGLPPAVVTSDERPITDLDRYLNASMRERLNGTASSASKPKGKKPVIYFIGDSLIRFQYQTFCEVLTGVYPNIPHARNDVQNCSSSLGRAVWLLRTMFDPDAVDFIMSAGEPAPTVVYFDSGLWLLHVHPLRKMTSLMFKHITSYVHDLQQTFEAYRKAVPDVGLTVMTPYSVDERKYHSPWYALFELRKRDFAKATQPCITDTIDEFPSEAKDVCWAFWFDRRGSELIRNKVIHTVLNSQDLPGGPATLIDAWAKSDGHCNEWCKDGRHYLQFAFQTLHELLQKNGY